MSSGLTVDDANALGLELLTAADTKALSSSFLGLQSMKINYYGTDGQPITDYPQGDPFFRVRYLTKSKDFSGVAGGKQQRYSQLPDTLPVAYFPRNIEWLPVATNYKKPLLITEGELKAAKACKEGFACVGLGGVYNWRAMKAGIEWLPSLDLVEWRRRNVYVCFDSDYKTNPQVCKALWEFAEKLVSKGSMVYLVTLPAIGGLDKTGLDDFLVHSGTGAQEKLRTLLAEAEPLGLSAPLWTLNHRFLYVGDPGMVVDVATTHKIPPQAFVGHHQAAATYQERALKSNGMVSYKPVPAAQAWLKWPLRNEATGLVYEPGASAFITQEKMPGRYWNTWPGWGCVRSKGGSAKPFIDLLTHLFAGSESCSMHWFLCWLAYPLQNPGAKLFTSAVIHGVRHGTGKSMVGYTMARIYGRNFTEISAADLQRDHNDWAENKQFVMGDDVAGSNKRAEADNLKKLITQKELRLNPKFIPTYTIRDCINYLFTSNHSDAFFLEDDDRRFAIFEVLVGPLPGEFYTAYIDWLDNKDGAEQVFEMLLEYDTKDWNPAAPAMKNAARARMINNGQSDHGEWCRALIDSPDSILHIGNLKLTKDLFTSKELVSLYDPDGRTKVTANGISRELAKLGVRMVNMGFPVKTSDGKSARYLILRNADKWTEAAALDAQAYLNGQLKTGGTGEKF